MKNHSTFVFLVVIYSATFGLISGDPSAQAQSPVKPPHEQPQADVRVLSDNEDSDNEDPSERYQVSHENDHACTYFYNTRYPEVESGLANCTWYMSKSCCKRTEVTSVFSSMDPLYSASTLCRNYINYLMCFFCSPDQYKVYDVDINKLSVCHDYCDALYEECQKAGFNRTLIGEAYANGTAFCEAQNFKVVDGSDCFKFDPNVFGASTTLHTIWSIIIAGIFLTLRWL